MKRRRGSSLAFLVTVGLALLAIGATWVRAAMLYPTLPDPFPINFDAAGAPNRWTPKSIPNWFMLPAIALIPQTLLLSVGWWGRALVMRAPGLVNVPNQALFIRLSPEGRLAVFEPTRLFVAFTATLVTLLFLYVLEGTAGVATGRLAGLPVWPVGAFLGLVFASIVPYWLATSRRVREVAASEGVAEA